MRTEEKVVIPGYDDAARTTRQREALQTGRDKEIQKRDTYRVREGLFM